MKLNYTFFILSMSTLILSSKALGSHFGIDGFRGHSGYAGTQGRAGQNKVLQADGSEKFYDLSGDDGTPGGNASHGSDAYGCSQPWNPPFNLFGAHGGDGGYGGNGGSGGNGGDLTVYFSDYSHLKNIIIDARGGRASLGGLGGQAGAPCRCYNHYWTVEKCVDYQRSDGTWDRICTQENFSCWDGNYGRPGLSGSQGLDGRYGSITLIPQLTPIDADVPAAQLRLSQISQGATLAANTWEQRSGARALFAAGSSITNNYAIYTGRRLYPVSFRWTARRSLQDFASSVISLVVRNGVVSLNTPDSIWVESKKTSSGNNTEFNFTKLIKASEATQLSVTVRGSGRATELVIKDAAEVSDLIQSSITLKLEADTLFDRNLFDGSVPSPLLNIKAHEVAIKVGQMGIKDKYLATGKGLKAKLQVSRVLGTSSATWAQDWAGKIK